jgi:hypothetical protein
VDAHIFLSCVQAIQVLILYEADFHKRDYQFRL